jgi:hypothetical protein
VRVVDAGVDDAHRRRREVRIAGEIPALRRVHVRVVGVVEPVELTEARVVGHAERLQLEVGFRVLDGGGPVEHSRRGPGVGDLDHLGARGLDGAEHLREPGAIRGRGLGLGRRTRLVLDDHAVGARRGRNGQQGDDPDRRRKSALHWTASLEVPDWRLERSCAM